jgi:hypothetical protein
MEVGGNTVSIRVTMKAMIVPVLRNRTSRINYRCHLNKGASSRAVELKYCEIVKIVALRTIFLQSGNL